MNTAGIFQNLFYYLHTLSENMVMHVHKTKCHSLNISLQSLGEMTNVTISAHDTKLIYAQTSKIICDLLKMEYPFLYLKKSH